jgi:putative ABC transport system permease protein
MRGVPAAKLWRDLRASSSRLLLMVVAIAVSLTVLGGVLFAWSAIGRQTRSAYLGTEPASATIVLDRPVDAERMADIVTGTRQRPGVIAATDRTQFTTEIEINGRPRDVSLQVFVAPADDPMRMAKFHVEGGSWPPAPAEILIGRDSLGLLGVAVGDTVTLTTPARDTVRLRVAGTVYDPSLAPAPQEQKAMPICRRQRWRRRVAQPASTS